jgi:hypothetical protein
VTLARWERDFDGHVLHMAEGVVSAAKSPVPGRFAVRESKRGRDPALVWPAAAAALVSGSWSAHLSELAHVLQLRFVCHAR